MMKINATLLYALFDNPQPQPQKEEVLRFYQELNDRIFPNRSLFISYLKAQVIDSQYEYAAKILHSLCFYSNFPPPYYALTDITCVENYQKGKTQKIDNYIPRDHFLHIVNLYILGIYIFFYDSEFYTRIVLENRFERSNEEYVNAKRDCIKDFLSEWKYFCLFHDVGYSAEALSNQSKNCRSKAFTKLQNENSFKKSFSQNTIVTQMSFFGTVEIIARIVLVRMILDYADEKVTLDHKMFKVFQQSPLCCYPREGQGVIEIGFSEVGSFIDQSIRLEKIYSNHCLKAVLPAVGAQAVSIIGSLKDSGTVVFISYYDNILASRRLVFLKGFEDHPELRRLGTSPDLLLLDDYVPTEFELEYLLGDENCFNDFYEFAESDYYRSVFDRANTDLKEQFISISNERQFLEFQYTVYEWFFNLIERLLNRDLENILDRAAKAAKAAKEPNEVMAKYCVKINPLIFQSLEGRYYDNINQTCLDCLKEKLEHYHGKPPGVSNKELGELVSIIVKDFFSSVQELAKEKTYRYTVTQKAKEQFLSNFEQDNNLLWLYSKLYMHFKRMLDKHIVSFNYDYVKAEAVEPPFLQELIGPKVEEYMHGMTLKEVQDAYVIPYENRSDHGIVSSQYAAGIFEVYRNAIESATDEKEKKLLSVLFNISGDFDKARKKYIQNYDHVFRNVLFAVFVHNLYPSQFKDEDRLKNHKTCIQDSFSYLALLCDAMQQWNRPHMLLPAFFESRPNEDTSEDYDICVKDNTIYIFESTTKTAQNRLTHNIQLLSEYLNDVNAFLKNGTAI